MTHLGLYNLFRQWFLCLPVWRMSEKEMALDLTGQELHDIPSLYFLGSLEYCLFRCVRILPYALYD
jgi:hypothetical protein